MNADDILRLVRARHSNDVFVPECKTGPTWSNHCPRLDAWAMARSWTHPRIDGYEIKVTRPDWLQDNKWMKYIPFCNYLWFVTASGICKRDEIPADVGWLEVSRTGGRLFTRKKAPYRTAECEDMDPLFRYLLMSRARIDAGEWSKTDQIERELSKKVGERKLGRLLGRRMAKSYSEEVEAARAENASLRKQNQSFEDNRILLRELGITDGRNISRWTIEDRVKALNNLIPDHLKTNLMQISNAISQGLKDLERYRTEMDHRPS